MAIDEYGNSAEYASDFVLEKANASSASAEKIKNNLTKLGDTVFLADTVEINIDKDVFIPTSEINKARREVTEKLEKAIINLYKRSESNTKHTINQKHYQNSEFDISVCVSDTEQLNAIRKTDCKRIYVPIELNDFKENEIVVLPRISPDNLEDMISKIKNKSVLVRNIGQIEVAKRYNKTIYLDFTMNVFNSYSCDFFKSIGIENITLSTELTLKQIKPLTQICNCECVIYGKIPMMITENCIIKSSVGCQKGGYLYDRTNEAFLVKCLADCRNEIYNSKPIVMSDKIDDIIYSGISYGRLNFVDETSEQCVEIYNCYKKGNKISSEFTRGKFYKGV